jgi:GNAT superfamily N-acetyltransferase
MFDDLGVRLAQPEEVHDIMEAALRACSENGFVNPNQVKVLQQVWCGLNLDNGLIGVIGEPGKLEGGILLRVADIWYSDDKVLEERAIFILPEYRGVKGGRARRLCEFAKRAAETMDMPLLIGVLSNHRTEAKVRLYERQFGKPTGAFFLYNGRTGSVQAAAE